MSKPSSIEQHLFTCASSLSSVTQVARLEAEILFCFVLNISRAKLYTRLPDALSEGSKQAIDKLVARRLKHEPMAYILGEKEFFGHSFRVGPGVLIPRPETELLVEQAAFLIKKHNLKHVLELGFGSGCISICLAKLFPSLIITAWDVSQDAFFYAQENARAHEIDTVSFLQQDGLASSAFNEHSFDLIVSNPPYIGMTEKKDLAAEVLNYEPHQALFAEAEGLSFYQAIAKNAKKMAQHQQHVYTVLELGAPIAQRAFQIFLREGWQDLEILKDYAGHDRVLIGRT